MDAPAQGKDRARGGLCEGQRAQGTTVPLALGAKPASAKMGEQRGRQTHPRHHLQTGRRSLRGGASASPTAARRPLPVLSGSPAQREPGQFCGGAKSLLRSAAGIHRPPDLGALGRTQRAALQHPHGADPAPHPHRAGAVQPHPWRGGF